MYPVETLTIADQLASGRFGWRAYLEGMVDEAGQAANCVNPDPDATDAPPPGGYSAAQNPFLTLLAAGMIGVLVALAGAPLPA